MAGAWSCPHESADVCARVGDQPCRPGMKGCVLYRRYVIFDGDSVYPPRAHAAGEKLDNCEAEAEPKDRGS